MRHHRRVAGQTRRVVEARRRAAQQLREVGEEIRRARLAAGMTQGQVATRLACQRQRIARIEAGAVANVPLPDLAAAASVVGLRLGLRAYPHGSPLRDAGQLAVALRLQRRLSPAWHRQLEAPVQLRGDLRAFDLVLRRADPPATICVEILTRLTDAQAQLRAIHLKWRDAAPPGADLAVVLADTRHNRRALALVRTLLSDAYPLGTRETLLALSEGREPGGNGIAFA